MSRSSSVFASAADPPKVPLGSTYRPVAKPWSRRGLNGPPPRTASRMRSENEPMPVPAMFTWIAFTPRPLLAMTPKFQPSPYR